MHDFRIPSDDILIEQDIGEDNFWNYGGYKENETLVDPFFRKYKWIRYTYDFGDDWRHKIMIEKIDESSCFAFDPDETIQKKASPMTKKVDAWKKLCEDAKLEKLKLSEPKYTQRELLQALDNQEASDYCKYLQIPVKVSDSKDDKTDAVCKMLQLNPEYLLYIFIQEN